MTAHVIDIDTEQRTDAGAPYVRWRCSCGKAGPWLLLNHARWLGRTSASRRARNGGVRHQRAMDR